jgi:hypothetical protein
MTLSSTALYMAVFCLLVGFLKKVQYDQKMSPLLASYKHPTGCSRIGEGLLSGPEDLAMDTTHNLVFVSSHNRRSISSTGNIFAIDVATDNVIEMQTSYPPQFRPHGIAIAQSCESFSSVAGDTNTSITRLFVISHVGLGSKSDMEKKRGKWEEKGPMHTIEVFDFLYPSNNSSSSVPLLRHVNTLNHSYLHSPNDLIALNCNELIISNDLPRGASGSARSVGQLLSTLLLPTRSANMIHHNVLLKSWSYVTEVHVTQEVVPPSAARGSRRDVQGRSAPRPSSTKTSYNYKQALASFGNGLIALPHSRSWAPPSPLSLLLRASSADYSVLDYQTRHQHGPESHLTLSEEVATALPISPDNLEPSPLHPMEVLVAGHPSLLAFALHALPLPLPLPLSLGRLLRPSSPSAVLRYNALWRNYSLLYYSDGGEVSGSSVAVMSNGLGGSDSDGGGGGDGEGGGERRKLYIGQVFDSFVLSCPVTV